MPACGDFRRLGTARRGRRRKSLLADNADGPPPFVERIENVGLAELDPDWPAARPVRVVPLEVPVDTLICDLDGHSPAGPSQHLLERWTDDPNQVAIVLPAQIRFDRPAVLIGGVYNHRPSPDLMFCVAVPTFTISAPSSSMFSASPTCCLPAASHSTRRPNMAAARPRHASTTCRPRPFCSSRYRDAIAARHSASTSPRSTGRLSSASIDVARDAISAGYAADWTLIPIPSTTCPTAPSARMPASFRPPTWMSLGHFTCGESPVADAIPSDTATP